MAAIGGFPRHASTVRFLIVTCGDCGTVGRKHLAASEDRGEDIGVCCGDLQRDDCHRPIVWGR